MQLGAVPISLTVKDVAASQAFYENLGFAAVGGDADQGWLVLRGGTTPIGLLHGLFERNFLTFNPGRRPEATPLAAVDTVRAIQARLKAAGLELTRETLHDRPARLTGPPARPKAARGFGGGTPDPQTSAPQGAPFDKRRADGL